MHEKPFSTHRLVFTKPIFRVWWDFVVWFCCVGAGNACWLCNAGGAVNPFIDYSNLTLPALGAGVWARYPVKCVVEDGRGGRSVQMWRNYAAKPSNVLRYLSLKRSRLKSSPKLLISHLLRNNWAIIRTESCWGCFVALCCIVHPGF